MEKKVFFKRLFVFLFGIILVAGVLAETTNLDENLEGIVTDVLSKKGISDEAITNIQQVDYNNLPDAINIENIDSTNLAIYEVEIGGEAPVYVITASDELFERTSRTLETGREVSFLNFGHEGEMKNKDEFLSTATGVETSLEKGYVMMRDGSITGISTNLEIVRGSGEINIIVYINGKEIEFENNFVGDSEGVQKDYDIQSEETVRFEAGDVISVSVEANANVVYKDVITMIEIVTIR